MEIVKTTIDIQDALFLRAKQLADKRGTSFRALVEEGLRRMLDERRTRYRLPDRSAGKVGDQNPLEAYSWQDLRAEIYSPRHGG